MIGIDDSRAHREPPDPGSARTVDGLIECLRALRNHAGSPSYRTITARVDQRWGKTTVVDCFRIGRRRLDTDLVLALVEALYPHHAYVDRWRQALEVVGAERAAAAQVRVSDALPPDLPAFTGRVAELARIRRACEHDDAAVVTIEGMAGAGKTQLAVRAGHLLRTGLERVFFVDLRGFHPEPGQPPADPAAVLDGFLRLLGVPGNRIPYHLSGRVALFRERIAATRAVIVLDNAVDAEQVVPLVPRCVVLVTSRRSMRGLRPTLRLTLDGFSPGEAVDLLTRAVPEVPRGEDPAAASRIAERCGRLPLALGLVAGNIRARPGWTLTDHADRLDELHRERRLDGGVEIALSVSYEQLDETHRRMFRLLSQHRGQDLGVHAAAALTGDDLDTAARHLRHLHDHHLLHQVSRGRFGLHDLIRTYAMSRASDEERPADRRAALNRLFDFYLAATAAAMDVLFPAEAHLRPRIAPPATPVPDLTDPAAARAWLDTERPTLVAMTAHDLPSHTTRLSRTMFRYLAGGHQTDAVIVHGNAVHAAHRAGDPVGEGHARTDLGAAFSRLGRLESASEQLTEALRLFEEAGEIVGQGRVRNSLGVLELRRGRPRAAVGHLVRAAALHRQSGNPSGEAHALGNLGDAEMRLGRFEVAAGRYARILELTRQIGDLDGEANALNSLGEVEIRMGRLDRSGDHLREALAIFRRNGNRTGEGSVLDGLGMLHTRRGRLGEAVAFHRQAVEIARETGDRWGEAWALNGLGEASPAAEALTWHQAAIEVATASGDRGQEARGHAGLGRAHLTLGDRASAQTHLRYALQVYTDLESPEAAAVRDLLDS